MIDGALKISIIFDCIDWYDEMYVKEHGVDSRYYLLQHAYLELLKRASKVIAQSPVILRTLFTWGLQTKKAMVIPNGYDERYFFPYSIQKVAQLKNSLHRNSVLIFRIKILLYTAEK